jgi:chemotaxis protein MotB
VREHQPPELYKKLENSERKRVRLRRRLAGRPAGEGGQGWGLADMMTLLLIFFILFYAQNMARNEAVTEKEPDRRVQVQASFNWTAPQAIEVDKERLEEMKRKVALRIDGRRPEDLQVQPIPKGVVFVLGERISFTPGEAALLPEAAEALVEIADIIKDYPDCLVKVSGHTDDRPIATRRFPSNLELSAARAASVANGLIQKGAPPERVFIQGFSAFRPRFPNDSPEHRQANRRVEISLVRP